MGFDKDDISAALFATDGNAEKTLDLLIASKSNTEKEKGIFGRTKKLF